MRRDDVTSTDSSEKTTTPGRARAGLREFRAGSRIIPRYADSGSSASMPSDRDKKNMATTSPAQSIARCSISAQAVSCPAGAAEAFAANLPTLKPHLAEIPLDKLRLWRLGPRRVVQRERRARPRHGGRGQGAGGESLSREAGARRGDSGVAARGLRRAPRALGATGEGWGHA